ncbi:MAG: DUF1330 domain-containing protein [Thermoanaerobaculia bacterium]
MPKAYWVNCYRSVRDEAALARYAALARPAIEAHGGRFLARATASKSYEAGLLQRVVIVEFPSLESATAAHESADYQAALAELAGTAERDLRIVEGL